MIPPPLTREPLAHLDRDRRAHLLIDHLNEVGALAARFAHPPATAAWARLAGLWHDLGKYGADFQQRIREENGYEAHLRSEETLDRDHSSAGAVLASGLAGGIGLPIAFAIAGHHAGLPNAGALKERLERKRPRLELALSGGVPAALLAERAPPPPPHLLLASPGEAKRRLELWTRMVFSALCDADFLDTERFYRTASAADREGYPGIGALADRLRAAVDAFALKCQTTPVNQVRAEVLAACRTSAALAPGVFSLSVPTGSGKTLASLSFALEHARRHGLDRVIVAIPFTSIIEQTAEAYRDQLGPECVVEHHSALDPLEETPRNRVASENWDAPVVVTTTVQLFESLFHNRPGRCRKLHNLARSVIVLDEAQTLPVGLLDPILSVLRALTEDYGTSVVVSTATQPALGRARRLPEGLVNMRELVPPEVGAFERLRRVKVSWPDLTRTSTWDEIADRTAAEPSVLAIVHRRDDANTLVRLLDARLGHTETIHLSALMCPEHRSEVIRRIKAGRLEGRPLRVVATQLVESGVDLDFPVVFRALGGIDAMAQAAGRCNREGRLEGLGSLEVFVSPSRPPKGVLQTAAGIARGMLAAEPELDLFAPETARTYFERLYSSQQRDSHEIQRARHELRFQDTAELFSMIEDGWSAPVVVPYGDAIRRLAELERERPSRERLRGLQRFTVNVPKALRERWLAAGLARPIAETVVALDPTLMPYDLRFGVLVDAAGVAHPKDLIVEG